MLLKPAEFPTFKAKRCGLFPLPSCTTAARCGLASLWKGSRRAPNSALPQTCWAHSCHRAFALSVLLPEMLLVWICTAHSFTSSRLCSNIPLSTTPSPENSHVPHPFLPHPALFLFSLQTCFIICICLSFIVYLSPLECQLCEVRNQFHSLKHAKCPESRRHSRNTC